MQFSVPEVITHTIIYLFLKNQVVYYFDIFEAYLLALSEASLYGVER
jgi:hypothetical protein